MKKKLFFLLTLIISYFAIILWAQNYGQYYHQTIYPIINRLLFFKNINIFHRSLGDVLYLLIGLLLLWKIITLIKNKQWLKSFFFIGQTVLILLISFQILWGINNHKDSLHKTLNIPENYTTKQLIIYTEKAVLELNELHQSFNQPETPVQIPYNLDWYYKEALTNLKKVNFLQNYPIDELTTARPSLYNYFLTKAGFSGYFNPFFHSNQINSAIPTIGLPMTFTHEMTHQLGFASEAEANFIAYLALEQSENPSIRYSAKLYALKFILREVKNHDNHRFEELYAQLNKGIQLNIEETNEFWKNNKGFSSKIYQPAYGGFLKMNNQKDGMKSYNRMVNFILNYTQKK